MKLPVNGHNGLYREKNSGAIINCNVNEYEEYIKLKNIKLSEKNEIIYLKLEIERLKSNIETLIKKI